MNSSLIKIIFITILFINNTPLMSLTIDGKLNSCISNTNCLLVEWKFNDIDKSFEKLINHASSLPRTKIIIKQDNYWHGVCRSFIFRFPDDLEILKLPREGLIQVRSSSRIGVSDLGVNSKRINNLYEKLEQVSFIE